MENKSAEERRYGKYQYFGRGQLGNCSCVIIGEKRTSDNSMVSIGEKNSAASGET